ncbi:hypothetical protein DPMN_176245 [Dreissena polymorpha]|uniref:Uncharacterized protein n=1 Tax=Dreissena polymorpha TaxID=45954 RepID=A0A9D4E6K2_DREPO|nr:hypothetical protein DPMN_176245 [Dreissena polymorpha]
MKYIVRPPLPVSRARKGFPSGLVGEYASKVQVYVPARLNVRVWTSVSTDAASPTLSVVGRLVIATG